MKYMKLSLVTLSLVSTVAMAGGDIDIMEPSMAPLEYESPTDENYNIYMGAGYTYIDAEIDGTQTGNAYTLFAGYNINEYVALELRYSDTVGEMDVTGDKSIFNRANGSYDRSVSNAALYIKPQYHVLDDLNLYGLLGYGKTNLRATDVSSFQWGVGASYEFIDDLDFYVDYSNLTSDDIENVGRIENNTWESQVSATTVGLIYKF